MKSVSQHAVNMVSRNERLSASRELLVEEYTVTKKLFILLVVLGGLIAVALFSSNAISKMMHMSIDLVEVRGDLHFVSEQDIQAVIARELNDGYIDKSLSAIKDEIELLPWIYNVRLQRAWKNKLIVDVVEQKPVAIWDEKSFLNEQGEVFTPQDFKKPEKSLLPELVGPKDGLEQTWATYQKMESDLSKYNLGLRKMVLDEKGGQKIVLNNGIHVIFGSQDIDKRLARFFKVYKYYLAGKRKNVNSVDLRYTNGIAVSWLNQKSI